MALGPGRTHEAARMEAAVPASSSTSGPLRGKWGIWTEEAQPMQGARKETAAMLWRTSASRAGRSAAASAHAKEYSFREALPRCSGVGGALLTREQLRHFDESGFLLGLPMLSPEEVEVARRDFDELLGSRIDKAPSEDARFRSAHTLSRPLHQDLVARLAQHPRVLAAVEDILGPHFVCWSAHLFCKLPGDPTEQPWHQDAGFWPLSESRALTLWLAFDDVDASNSAVTFIEGSHRLGRIPWQPTDAECHLLTQEIPDAELLGQPVTAQLRAGEASLHCDLTVHGSRGNGSTRRRAGLALRFVGAEAECLGPMING
eukprot:CAMPEP_0179175314 /NCGR_PEP_ID=MMETSP0796-20121207/86576_1 /TAXON_ID=73915 /ORGANISM="Pyrodinium bahamense, Strain pbaha01" /LENGTH=316 /DNA_ID=CAMNT_0020878641 /DNA_START=30 /DNA_END=977 /DNA_ORIENTATION=-